MGTPQCRSAYSLITLVYVQIICNTKQIKYCYFAHSSCSEGHTLCRAPYLGQLRLDGLDSDVPVNVHGRHPRQRHQRLTFIAIVILSTTLHSGGNATRSKELLAALRAAATCHSDEAIYSKKSLQRATRAAISTTIYA